MILFEPLRKIRLLQEVLPFVKNSDNGFREKIKII